jgi:polysaccharide export outer membrane protein
LALHPPSLLSRWPRKRGLSLGRPPRPIFLGLGLLCTLAGSSLLAGAAWSSTTLPVASLPTSPTLPARPPSAPAGPGGRLSLSEVYNDLYVLGPGDGLQLNFLDPAAKEVGGGFGILPDGTTTLPLLGSVQLNGLTIGQATRWLTSLYGRQLVRPQLYLTLTAPRAAKVTIIGEVEKPGLYSLGAFSTPITAIQTAGGINLNSDIHKVILRRLAGPDGSIKQTTLDLSQVLLQGNQLQNPVLFDGDTLIINKTNDFNPAEVREIGRTNIAQGAISVNIIGEVKGPGSISLPPNTPLVEAIFKAGGPVKWRANTNKIELIRITREGKFTRQIYRYNQNQGISQGENPPLRNGDTIIVNKSLYGMALDAINDVAVPISAANSVVNLYNTWYFFRYNNNYNNNR